MFSLEQSIADWRRQMLAAGIKTPGPLEELEIHLREEIEQQMKSGLNEQEIFNSAVQKIGQAGLLKTEFKKAGGLIDWLGDNKSTRTNRILGALWLAYCSWNLFMMVPSLLALQYAPGFNLTIFFLVTLLFGYIYLRGIIGSILLFGGITRYRRAILMIAFLGIVGFVGEFFAVKKVSAWAIALTVFNIASIWLLRLPPKDKAGREMKSYVQP